MSYPYAREPFSRQEVVYHEELGAALLFDHSDCLGLSYPPLSSNIDCTTTKLIFSEFQFQILGGYWCDPLRMGRRPCRD